MAFLPFCWHGTIIGGRFISATKKDMYTLTIGIASSQRNFAQTEGLGFLAAQAVFASLPVIIVYIFFQRNIVTAVSGGAVK